MIAKEHSRFRLLLLQSLNICQPLNIKVILVQSLKQIGTPYLLHWSPGCCPQLRHEAGLVLLLHSEGESLCGGEKKRLLSDWALPGYARRPAPRRE